MKTTVPLLLAVLAATAFAPASAAQPHRHANLSAHEARTMAAASPKARLGKLLFEDATLSSPPGQACASCHAGVTGFADPRRHAPTSSGAREGLFGDRNTPALAYMTSSPAPRYDRDEASWVGGFFWDGRAGTLEEQAKGPFLNPVEMAAAGPAEIVGKVRAARYAPLFREVFGADALDDPTRAFDRIAEAIAAYERTPVFAPYTSKYDAWLARRATLTPAERRGLDVFVRKDKGNCEACHPVSRRPDGRGGLGTDHTYDNLGVPANPDNPFYRLAAAFNPAGERMVDRGLGDVVRQPPEYGKFKVPTVRNVEVTAPYMHNGYFATLRGVVEFYNSRDAWPRCEEARVTEAEALHRRCWPRPEMVANVNVEELGRLRLTPREVDDLVAFMLTLTDGWRPPARRSGVGAPGVASSPPRRSGPGGQ